MDEKEKNEDLECFIDKKDSLTNREKTFLHCLSHDVLGLIRELGVDPHIEIKVNFGGWPAPQYDNLLLFADKDCIWIGGEGSSNPDCIFSEDED